MMVKMPNVQNVHITVKLANGMNPVKKPSVLLVKIQELTTQNVNVKMDIMKKLTFVKNVLTNVKLVEMMKKNVSNVLETESTHQNVNVNQVNSITVKKTKNVTIVKFNVIPVQVPLISVTNVPETELMPTNVLAHQVT